jgi:hypothetical protein
VVSSVGFDDEARGLTEEVHDEGAERLLTPELRAVELPMAKQPPQALLRRRCGPSQGTSAKCTAPKESGHATASAPPTKSLRTWFRPPLPWGEGAGGEGSPHRSHHASQMSMQARWRKATKLCASFSKRMEMRRNRLMR